jgi:hypothetical protein
MVNTVNLLSIQVEFFYRPLAGMAVPPVGQHYTPDIQKKIEILVELAMRISPLFAT